MTLAEKIVEAEEALHRLLTGSLEQEVEYDGQRVKFGATDAAKLSAYISQLKAELAGQCSRGFVGFVL
jgi:hypothetical protein